MKGIQLNAAARLLKASESQSSTWFESLSDQQKADYLELHPDSKFNKHKSVVHKRPLSTDDRKRIQQLKEDIKTNTQDIADFEEDGDTEYAEKTRKIVERSKQELKELLSRQ